jgi:hypothetical protein
MPPRHGRRYSPFLALPILTFHDRKAEETMGTSRFARLHGRKLLLTILPLAALGLATVSFGPGVERSANAAQSPVAIAGLSRLALGDDAKIGTANLPRYAYVLLSVTESNYIPAIKKASPRTKVLGFQTAMEAVDYCLPDHMLDCPSPISYQQAVAHDKANPSDPWLLYSASKRSMTMPHYPENHLANVGSASFQRRWVANAVRTLRAHHFEGVYIDSVLGNFSDIGPRPPLYPTDASWESAMRKFVAYVGRTLKAKGFYVLINTYKSGPNDGSADIAWWASLAPHVSGLQAEYWQQAANPPNAQFDTNPCCWTGHWVNWLKLADAAQKNGADFFTVNKGTSTNTKLMTYLRASYLLVWNGRGGGFSYAHEPTTNLDPWHPAWTTDIGKPSGSRYQVGLAWRRNYSKGTAIVNPDPKRAQTVSLGGRYRTITGTTVTSVTLQPRSAAILLRG